MGVHKNIGFKSFPKQGECLNKDVQVCFRFDTEKKIKGKCIRDDVEEPYRTVFQLDDGRVVLATECQYTY